MPIFSRISARYFSAAILNEIRLYGGHFENRRKSNLTWLYIGFERNLALRDFPMSIFSRIEVHFSAVILNLHFDFVWGTPLLSMTFLQAPRTYL